MLKFLMIAFMVTVFTSQGQAQEKNWTGTWQYSAPSADYPYQNGKIIFSGEEKELKVVLETNGRKIEARNIKAAKNQVSFDLTIEGELIKVSLQVKDKKLTGTASYSGGEIALSGKRPA
ncbi:hypothetical protein EDD80_101434 [Anseongella ginsenosidimutans]|uniref:Lipocalin-like protein n=2 Tax=Anseongella ginsenosidimutans TaxID=496056 RepID=A0A4R3KX43_9SPHI|nr:hypothetical protein EDD80_101434 [Anseongella ginsenosidimutans]